MSPRGLRLAAALIFIGLLLLGLLRLALLPAPDIRPSHVEERDRQGQFDYYVLVLGWSPSYCKDEGADRNDGQCAAAHPHAFVLHGLWPQNVKGWPQDCGTEEQRWVPLTVIAEMQDIMPSKNLIIHEYRAHGACSGLGPEQYFKLARKLYGRIAIPAKFAASRGRLDVGPDEIEADFLRANTWLKPEMMTVSCRRGALLDVRICFGKDLAPRACGPNEERRDCRLRTLTVPPATPR